MRAGELVAVGVRQAEVARQLGVSRQGREPVAHRLADRRHRWAEQPPTDRAGPRVSDAQHGQVEQALFQDAIANGFDGELLGGEKATLM